MFGSIQYPLTCYMAVHTCGIWIVQWVFAIYRGNLQSHTSFIAMHIVSWIKHWIFFILWILCNIIFQTSVAVLDDQDDTLLSHHAHPMPLEQDNEDEDNLEKLLKQSTSPASYEKHSATFHLTDSFNFLDLDDDNQSELGVAPILETKPIDESLNPKYSLIPNHTEHIPDASLNSHDTTNETDTEHFPGVSQNSQDSKSESNWKHPSLVRF